MAPVKKSIMKAVMKQHILKTPTPKPKSDAVPKVLKRPAALTKKNLKKHDDDPASASQTLDEKIMQFEKKPTDMNTWLGKLSKNEREAVWKRFEYDRKACPGAEEAWQQAATGKKSMSVKVDLLKVFLMNKSSCKAPAMQNAFLSYGVTIGQKSKESWRPFVYMANYYGVAELFRRVKDGSILARKDGNEWEFKLVQTTSYKDEHNAGGYTGSTQGKLSDDKWADLQSAAHQLNLGSAGSSNDSGVLRFLQDKVQTGARKALTDAGSEKNTSADKDIMEADKLSDLGTIGKRAKERVGSAVELLKKVSSTMQDPDIKDMLGNHIKILKKIDGKISVEDIKDKLIKAMQCVKKAKALQ